MMLVRERAAAVRKKKKRQFLQKRKKKSPSQHDAHIYSCYLFEVERKDT